MDTIPRAIIERARAGVDIVKSIGRDVALDRHGELFLGACPFHIDDRRDLCVDPKRRCFRCVACSASGDVLDFHSRLHGISYFETMRRLEHAHLTGAVMHGDVPEAEPAYVGLGFPAFRIVRAGKFVDVRVCPWPVIKLGRLASSHLQLDDLSVSRMHAVVEVTDRAWLVDLGSAGGTYVNGEHVQTKRALEVGDVVRIGAYELELLALVRPQTPDHVHEATLASACSCLKLAEQAVLQRRYDDARALLRAARAHVREPALERAREQLGGLEHDWPADEQAVPCWLDAAGLAALDALQDALLSTMHNDEAHLSAALEQAVMHNLSDDAPRLVYADWLQQRGDPRGEFIAAGIAEYRGELDVAGRWRYQELLDTVGARWTAEFTTQGVELEFRRGFPAIVRHRGPWSRAQIGFVRRWRTIYRIDGAKIPDVLAGLA